MPRYGASDRATASSSAPPAPTTRSTNRSAPAGAMSVWSIGCRSITNSWRLCSTTCPAPGCRSTTRRTRSATIVSKRSPIFTRRATTSPGLRAPGRRSIVRFDPRSSTSTIWNGKPGCAGGRSSGSRPSPHPRATATSSTPAPARPEILQSNAPTRTSCCSRRCATTSRASTKPVGRRPLPPLARAPPSGSSACCVSAASPI